MMELEVKEVGEVYVPEGAVIAKFVDYELTETRFGDRLRLWFEDGKGRFSIWVSPKVNERSNLGKILQGMGVELKPGAKVRLDDYIGRTVGLFITRNSNGFAKFAGVFRPGESPF